MYPSSLSTPSASSRTARPPAARRRRCHSALALWKRASPMQRREALTRPVWQSSWSRCFQVSIESIRRARCQQQPGFHQTRLVSRRLRPYARPMTSTFSLLFFSCGNTDSDESDLFHSISPSPMIPNPTDPKKSSESQLPHARVLTATHVNRPVCPVRSRRVPSLLSCMDPMPNSDLPVSPHHTPHHPQPSSPPARRSQKRKSMLLSLITSHLTFASHVPPQNGDTDD